MASDVYGEDRRPLVHVAPDADALAAGLAAAFVDAARRIIVERPFFVVLPGGNSPIPFFGRLASDYRHELPWDRVRFAWADERWVPASDQASNFSQARRGLFEPLGLDVRQVACPVSTELSAPGAAAAEYERRLRDAWAMSDGRPDWVLLGIGEDGHTASLFPGGRVDTGAWVVAVEDSPKPPPRRVTMTWTLLRRSKQLHIMATGPAKALAVREARLAASDPVRFPLHGARRCEGEVHWWLDRAAAGEGDQSG